MHVWILGASIFLQIVAAILALRIGHLTKRRSAWALIAVAIIFMGARRSVTFARVLMHEHSPPDMIAESIAFSISLLLVVGFAALTPELRRLRTVRERESRLGTVLENSLNEIYIFDATTLQFLQVNRGARVNLGYSMEELKSMTAVDIKPEFDRAKLEELVKPLRDGSVEYLSLHTLHLRKDGSTYPVEVNLQFSTEAKPDAFVALIADVTERHREETERRRLEVALEQADECITLLDSERRIQYANAAFIDLMGQPKHQLIGLPIEDAGHEGTFEIWGETARSLIDKHHWRGRVSHPIERGERVLDGTFGTFVGTGGDRQGYVGVVRDVTREVGLERELFHAQRMEAVGQLAGGVAHDFNNLLTVISGYADILRVKFGHDSSARKSVDLIARAAQRATLLTTQLLTFSRKNEPESRPSDVSCTLSTINDILSRLIEEDIEVVIRPDDQEAWIEVSPGQVEQVILNLAINGRDAMPNGGQLVIANRGVTFGLDEEVPCVELSPGSYVLLSVTDTGLGMDEKIRARIFDPFFTTKEPGKGTGLGLATVYGIVYAAGGAIRVDSTPGKGSSFDIYFPCFTGERAPEIDCDDPLPSELDIGTILLVEDDSTVRNLAQEVLESRGLQVVLASDGAEALELVQQRTTEFRLLISDCVMPHLSGPKLAVRVRELLPEIRIVLMSGYTGLHLEDSPDALPADVFLQKPFSPAQLLAAVQTAMSQAKTEPGRTK